MSDKYVSLSRVGSEPGGTGPGKMYSKRGLGYVALDIGLIVQLYFAAYSGTAGSFYWQLRWEADSQ